MSVAEGVQGSHCSQNVPPGRSGRGVSGDRALSRVEALRRLRCTSSAVCFMDRKSLLVLQVRLGTRPFSSGVTCWSL